MVSRRSPCCSRRRRAPRSRRRTTRAPRSAPEHTLAELTVDQVEARIAKNDGKTFVYDDNQDEVYAAGHVPGAKHLGIDNVPASAFPGDKEATLIFYCSSEH